MSGSFFHLQLSGRGRKAAGQSGAETAKQVVLSPPPRMSVSQLTTCRRSFTEELSAVIEHGLQGLGLWRTKLSQYDDDTVAALLDEFGVKASSVSWTGGFMGSLGFSHDEALEDARAAVRQAALWGAETLVVVPGGRNSHTYRHCWKTVKDAVLLLADEAGDRGLKLALLPMHPRFPQQTQFFKGLDDVLALLNEIQHPCAGLAFDSSEIVRTPKLLERIPEIAQLTTLVQISQNVTELGSSSESSHAELIAELLRRFHAAGYLGLFDVQVWSEEVWQTSLTDVMSACRRLAYSAIEPLVRIS